VLALSDPPMITEAPVLPLGIDCGGGAAWGATVVDFRAPTFALDDDARQDLPAGFAPWRIALGVDVHRFRGHARALFGAP
jgi:hypothetical protein